MSNHIANSVNCEPKIRSSATSTPVAAVMSLPRIRSTTSGDPEPEPGEAHHDPAQVEEHERVEVPDHVLLAQPPEEGLDEEPGDSRDHLPQPDPRALADAVDRPRRARRVRAR